MEKKNSRTKNASRNIICGGLDRFTAIVFPFIVRTMFIKLFGEEYLGLTSLYSSILQVLNIAELGLTSAVSAALYRPIAFDDHSKVAELLYLYDSIYKKIGCFIFVVGMAMMPFLNFLIKDTPPSDVNIYVLWGLYLLQTVLGYMLFAYRTTLLSAIQRSDISSIVAVILRTIISVIQMILIVFLKNVYIYIVLNVLYTVFYNCLCAYVCKKKYPQYEKGVTIDLKTKGEIKNNIFDLALQKIGNTLSNSFDSIVISVYLGLTTVAIYGNYNYVISAISIFISLVVTSITASIGNSVVVERIEKNYCDFMKIFVLHACIVSWCCICFLVLFKDFMVIWMGEKNLLNTAVVIALVARFYFEQVRRVVLNYKDALGLWKEDKWKPIIGGGVNLILNFITVKYYGIVGVAISTVVDFLVIEMPWETRVLFNNYFKCSCKDYIKELSKSVICTIVNSAVMYAICWNISIMGWFGMILKIIICIVVPSIMYGLEYKKDPFFKASLTLLMGAFSFGVNKK